MIDPSFEKQTTGGGREERHVFHAFVTYDQLQLQVGAVIHGLRISYSMIIDINRRIASCDHADLFG